MPILETMAEIEMPLLIHGEVTNEEVDIFDREKVFIETVLDYTQQITDLKFEHNIKDYLDNENGKNLCLFSHI